MTNPTVILLLILACGRIASGGFRMFKFSRSVDSDQYSVTQSPCPDVFQYETDENNNLVGGVVVERTDPEGKVQLDIELSVGNIVQGYNGKIILAEERQKVINDIMNGKPIHYRVLFPPWQNIPPRVTKVLANGELICSGPRIPIQMVPVLTVINLQHKLSLGVTPLISSSDPTADSSNIDNSAPQGGNQDSVYAFDVRADNLPTVPNNIYTENFRPNRQPQGEASYPYFNVNNQFDFNPPPDRRRPPPPDGPPPPYGRPPPPPPGEGPPPDGRPPPPRHHHRPPPPPRRDQGQINPQNPFLNGFSNQGQPNLSQGDIDVKINSDNPFLNQRTEPSTAVVQPSTKPFTRGKPTEDVITGNVNEICGRPITTNSLIVNGHSVPRGAYPWLVAIFRQLENLSLSYICSGSLISERHVVTAAHCVKLEYRRVKANEIVCIFGKLNIRKWVTAPGERMLEPESITVHPDYEMGKANADIAVMTFPDPIPFSKQIMPVCLWQGSSDLNKVVGDIGTVVGWGRDENGDVSTAEPRQVSMPIVEQLECLKGSTSSAGMALVEIVSKNTFCAGFRNGSGPCNGDSGSAFLLRKNGIFYLRGIVSTALSEATHRSCNLQEYVVFTDASKYLNWLMDIMRKI